MKKRTCVVLLMIGLVLVMAVHGAGLSIHFFPEDYFVNRYSYDFLDFNEDGVFELVINFSEAYAYSDGKVQHFRPAPNSEVAHWRTPSSIRNKDTGELKWIYTDGFPGYGETTNYEVTFDVQSFRYTVKSVSEWKDPFVPDRDIWEYEHSVNGDSGRGEGTADKQVIERLLTDPSYRPTASPTPGELAQLEQLTYDELIRKQSIPWYEYLFPATALLFAVALIVLRIRRK